MLCTSTFSHVVIDTFLVLLNVDTHSSCTQNRSTMHNGQNNMRHGFQFKKNKIGTRRRMFKQPNPLHHLSSPPHLNPPLHHMDSTLYYLNRTLHHLLPKPLHHPNHPAIVPSRPSPGWKYHLLKLLPPLSCTSRAIVSDCRNQPSPIHSAQCLCKSIECQVR